MSRYRGRTVLVLAVLVSSAALSSGCDRLGGASAEPTDSAQLPPGAVPVPVSASPVPTPVVAAPPRTSGSAAAFPSLAPLVKKAKPSVVTVRATSRRTNAFGRAISQTQGVGTGFVYDSKGYLLTNNHVIEGADAIEVKFADDKHLPAEVVGADKPTDVAVLKVAETDLPSLPLGDSKALEVGDWVVAIGNPFGLEHTVSAGILSAKGRTNDDVQGLDPTGYFNFLQTDASINPGNSGGPLLNLAGQVVGINAAVRANANNIGFAIPMEMVVQLLPMLLKDGKIHRSAIGITVASLSEEDMKLVGQRKGVKVRHVSAGKAADRAGLSSGDIILAFDGKAIADPNELRWLASIAGVSKSVSLRVARGSRVFDIRVTLGELESP